MPRRLQCAACRWCCLQAGACAGACRASCRVPGITYSRTKAEQEGCNELHAGSIMGLLVNCNARLHGWTVLVPHAVWLATALGVPVTQEQCCHRCTRLLLLLLRFASASISFCPAVVPLGAWRGLHRLHTHTSVCGVLLPAPLPCIHRASGALCGLVCLSAAAPWLRVL